MMWTVLKSIGGWAVSFLTGGSLDKILDTIEHRMDDETKKEEIKAEVTKTWITAQANLLVGRTWWFQLFFVLPLGVYWSALLWVSAFPMFGWEVKALPSPYYEWAASIVAALFIVDGGKALLNRFTGSK